MDNEPKYDGKTKTLLVVIAAFAGVIILLLAFILATIMKNEKDTSGKTTNTTASETTKNTARETSGKTNDNTNTATTTTNTNTSTNTSTTTTTTKDIPDNFVTYVNSELKIRFAYPKEWGTVSTETYLPAEHNDVPDAAGKQLIISFSKSKVDIVALTTDYRGYGITGYSGRTSLPNCTSSDIQKVGEPYNAAYFCWTDEQSVIDEMRHQISTEPLPEGDGLPGLSEYIIVNLPKDAKYGGMQIFRDYTEADDVLLKKANQNQAFQIQYLEDIKSGKSNISKAILDDMKNIKILRDSLEYME